MLDDPISGSDIGFDLMSMDKMVSSFRVYLQTDAVGIRVHPCQSPAHGARFPGPYRPPSPRHCPFFDHALFVIV